MEILTDARKKDLTAICAVVQ